jgi:hypothetical protein
MVGERQLLPGSVVLDERTGSRRVQGDGEGEDNEQGGCRHHGLGGRLHHGLISCPSGRFFAVLPGWIEPVAE